MMLSWSAFIFLLNVSSSFSSVLSVSQRLADNVIKKMIQKDHPEHEINMHFICMYSQENLTDLKSAHCVS